MREPRVVEVTATTSPVASLLGLYTHRELLRELVLRDVRIRYRQTLFGVLWAIGQPALLAVVTLLVLDRMHAPDQSPFSAYAALLPAQAFSGGFTRAAQSLVADRALVTRVYFPRLVVPFSAFGSVVLDHAVGALALVVALTVTGSLDLEIVLLPLALLAALLPAAAFGLVATALNALYRDVGHAVPFVSQLIFWSSPLLFSTSDVPSRYRWVAELHPLAISMELHRAIAGASQFPSATAIGRFLCVYLALFFVAIIAFVHMEKRIEDSI